MVPQECFHLPIRVPPKELTVPENELSAGQNLRALVTDPALSVKQPARLLNDCQMVNHDVDLIGRQFAMACLEKSAQFLAGLPAENQVIRSDKAFVNKVACMRRVAAAAPLLVEFVGVDGLSESTTCLSTGQHDENAERK